MFVIFSWSQIVCLITPRDKHEALRVYKQSPESAKSFQSVSILSLLFGWKAVEASCSLSPLPFFPQACDWFYCAATENQLPPVWTIVLALLCCYSTCWCYYIYCPAATISVLLLLYISTGLQEGVLLHGSTVLLLLPTITCVYGLVLLCCYYAATKSTFPGTWLIPLLLCYAMVLMLWCYQVSQVWTDSTSTDAALMVSVLSMLHRGQWYIEASLFYRCKEICLCSINTALMVSVPVFFKHSTSYWNQFNSSTTQRQIMQPLYYMKSISSNTQPHASTTVVVKSCC